jgi:hypothetical protein
MEQQSSAQVGRPRKADPRPQFREVLMDAQTLAQEAARYVPARQREWERIAAALRAAQQAAQEL